MPVPGSGARPSLCHLNWPLVLLLLPVMWHGEVSLFLVLPIASNNLLFLPCQLSKSKLTSCSFSSFSPHFWHCSPIPSCVLAQAFLFLVVRWFRKLNWQKTHAFSLAERWRNTYILFKIFFGFLFFVFYMSSPSLSLNTWGASPHYFSQENKT